MAKKTKLKMKNIKKRLKKQIVKNMGLIGLSNQMNGELKIKKLLKKNM